MKKYFLTKKLKIAIAEGGCEIRNGLYCKCIERLATPT